MGSIDYKSAFIKVLQEYEADLCSLCEHDYKRICNDKCQYFSKGRGLFDDSGKYYDWKWTCMDYDFADCPGLENSPCKACTATKFAQHGFSLDESKVLEYLKKLGE